MQMHITLKKVWEKLKFDDLKIIGSQTLFTYGSRVIHYLCQLGTLALITRGMSIENYGVLSVLRSVGEVVACVGGMGLSFFLSREIPGQSEEEQVKTLKYCLKHEISLFFILALFLVILSKVLTEFLNIKGFELALVILLIANLFWLINTEVYRFQEYRKFIRLSVSLTMLERVFFLAFIAVFFILMKETLEVTIVAIATLGAFFLMTLVCGKTLPSSFWTVRDKDQTPFHQAFFKARHYMVIDVILILSLHIDRYFLTVFHSPEEAGTYVYAMAWIMLLSRLSIVVFNVTYPYLAEYFKKRDYKRALKSFLISSGIGSFLIIGGGVGLFVFCPFLVKWVSGVDYLVVIPFIRGLILIPLFRLIGVICQNLLNLINLEKFIAYGLLSFLIVKMVLCVILIPSLKEEGAVWANNLSYLLACIFWIGGTFYFLRKKSVRFRILMERMYYRE